jgi:hypothetical protein
MRYVKGYDLRYIDVTQIVIQNIGLIDLLTVPILRARDE